MTTLPALQTPPYSDSPELYKFLTDVKQELDNANVDVLLTDNQLNDIALNLTGVQGDTGAPGVDGDDGEGLQQTSVIPSVVTGIQAFPSRTFTILIWDGATLESEVSFYKIYRSSIPDIGTAISVGTTLLTIYKDYTQVDAIYYYWLVAVSRVSVDNPDGLEGEYGSPVQVDIDSKINSLNIHKYLATNTIVASYTNVNTLAAINAILGDVVAGTLKNSTGTFDIDLINKYIEIAGPNGKNADDYVSIKNGLVEQFTWNGSSHSTIKGLSIIEIGTAYNGNTITLSKYYKTRPTVRLFPEEITTYDPVNYPNRSLKLETSARNLTEYTTGRYRFSIVCKLTINNSAKLLIDADGFVYYSGYPSSSPPPSIYNYAYGPTSIHIGAQPAHKEPNDGTTVYGFLAFKPGAQTSTFCYFDLMSVLGSGTAGVFQKRYATVYFYYTSSTIPTPPYVLHSTQVYYLEDEVTPKTFGRYLTGLHTGGLAMIYLLVIYNSIAGTFKSNTIEYSGTHTVPINTLKVIGFDPYVSSFPTVNGKVTYEAIG